MKVQPSLWDIVPRGEEAAEDTAGPRRGYDSSYTAAGSEIEYVAPEYAQVDYAQVMLSHVPGDDSASGDDDTYSTAEALAADDSKVVPRRRGHGRDSSYESALAVDTVTVVPRAATRLGPDNMTAI